MGMHLAHMVLVGHRVEGGEGAEGTVEFLAARVALLLVFAEQVLVRAGKVAVGTVERIVALVVGLHVLSRGKEQWARVVAALHSPRAVCLLQVSHEGLAIRRCVVAACLKAAQGRRCCGGGSRVAFEVLLEGLAEVELGTAHRAGVGVGVEVAAAFMHAGHVAVEGIALHGAVRAQRAAVGLLAPLPQQVRLELALAGKEFLAIGALEARVGEVQVEMLHQVGPLLKAALAFGAHVCLEEGLEAGSRLP